MSIHLGPNHDEESCSVCRGQRFQAANLVRYTQADLDAAVAEAVKAETIACAKVATYCYGTEAEEDHCKYVAGAIMARAGTTTKRGAT